MYAKSHGSPVDVPFVEEEPLFGLGQVNVNVLIDAADAEYFVVVSDGLCAEKLFRFLQAAIHALDLAYFCVQQEAVRDPTVVTTEDQNLLIIQWEASHRVTGRPVVFTIDVQDWFPLRSAKITTAIEALNAIQRLFILRIATANNVQESTIENANRMEMSA